MERIKVTYDGDMKTTATCGKSQIALHTDNSPESNASGATYTPVDMFVTSLGACMLSIMGMMVSRRGIDISGATVAMDYTSDDATHRVTSVTATFRFPGIELSDADRRMLQAAAKACPVGASLSPDIEKKLAFEF